ncbi:MAG: hypothetical protein HY301_15880 [Verrucomicrobia bacterium]|nr:hypothetical protein [Verrucomicrobiota bacterium]
MAAVNVTQCIGFLNEVADFLDKYKVQLQAKKYDPTDDIATARAAATALSKLDSDQEKLKTDLANKTTAVNAACDGGYMDGSDALTTAISKLGSRSVEAKEGTRIRKSLRGRGPNNGGDNTPPTPPNP